MAHTTIFDVDKNFVWPWFLDWDLFVYSWPASLLYYLRPLLIRDMGCILRAVRSVHDEIGSRNYVYGYFVQLE